MRRELDAATVLLEDLCANGTVESTGPHTVTVRLDRELWETVQDWAGVLEAARLR